MLAITCSRSAIKSNKIKGAIARRTPLAMRSPVKPNTRESAIAHITRGHGKCDRL
ncbi:MAG: hypothetical protein AB4352_17220 [Hormoscilla sp.]